MMVSLRKGHPAWALDLARSRIESDRVLSVELASAANTLVFAMFKWFRLASEFSKFEFRRAVLFSGLSILGSLDVFLDLDSVFTDSDIGRMRVNPASTIEIVDAGLVLVQGGMGVSAEDTRRFVMTCVG